jgi:hypothetical protein
MRHNRIGIFKMVDAVDGCFWSGDPVNWRAVGLLLVAIPLSFVSALLCAFNNSIPTPGQVALGLLPPLSSSGCCDLRPQGFIVLVDTLFWLLIFASGYAVVSRHWKLLRALRVPLAFSFASVTDGVAFKYGLFTPGVSFWRLVHWGRSSDYAPIALGTSLIIDAIVWLVIFFSVSMAYRRSRKQSSGEAA